MMTRRGVLPGLWVTLWAASTSVAGIDECLDNSDCDDGNPCTADACLGRPRTCSNTPRANGTACNDGNPCTTSDHCTNAVCHGTPVTGTSCNDGNGCTTNDTCNNGVCSGTFNCSDGNSCTFDACPDGSCRHTPLAGLPCDDGNPCIISQCNIFGSCVAVDFLNGFPCNDGNACTSGDVCSGALCRGAPVACDDQNVCTTDTCDPATGCISTNNIAPCDDADACTTDDICSGGSCVGGAALDCNDANGCTDDFCDPSAGCVHADNSNPCDDGNACTTNDTCTGGVCGKPPSALDEWRQFHDCFAGPGAEVDVGCQCSNLDDDTDVDLLDVAEFMVRLSGD